MRMTKEEKAKKAEESRQRTILLWGSEEAYAAYRKEEDAKEAILEQERKAKRQAKRLAEMQEEFSPIMITA